MLEFISVRNFKTLMSADFPLSKLNIFSGLNGMGKSTLIQSLLLLRQSYKKNTLEKKGLLLNGEYVTLGVGKDVFSISSNSEEVAFNIKWNINPEEISFKFKYDAESELLPHKAPLSDINFESLNLFNSKFQYLSAERLAPRTHHEISDYNIKSENNLGNLGEYAVHFIAENGRSDIPIKELRHPNSTSNSLLQNIEAWLSEISPGIRVNAVANTALSTATLDFVFKQGNENTQSFKPQNVGFGLSYVLPIITSILCAQKDELRIFENPESHLHPAGQSIMGKLCAIAACNGVQIIIESHSDHFLNGVRVAVKEKIIQAEEVQIFFLHRDNETLQHSSEVMNPKLDNNGRIDYWPKGFFDEWDNQLERLL